jgi:cell division protein FtsB
MTLLRMIFVLGATLAVMLAIVILRAEVTGLHYRISLLEQQAEVLVQQIREEELELQRLRNPALIRERARELRPRLLDAPARAPR